MCLYIVDKFLGFKPQELLFLETFFCNKIIKFLEAPTYLDIPLIHSGLSNVPGDQYGKVDMPLVA